MIITRRAFTAVLSLTGLAALAGFSPFRLIADAMAQSAADVSKPVSLPDMALGPANAKVTITEFASMTCPHCAAFNAEVFPKIKAEYIDTGKIRYVFREFPLDIKAAAGSMLARCIAKDDAGKYFAVIDLLFKQQLEWAGPKTTEILKRINGGRWLPRNHAVLARALLADTTSRLSRWECDFLASLERFSKLSPRQRWALRKICRRAYEVRIGWR